MTEEMENIHAEGEAFSPEMTRLSDAYADLITARGVKEALGGAAYLMLLTCRRLEVTSFESPSPTHILTVEKKGTLQ